MRVNTIHEEEMYRLLNEIYNPPVIQNQKEENLFQAEIRQVYDKLVEALSHFGEAGDYYGISDFAVRPDLRPRRTVLPPPAGHHRGLSITILTKKFFKSDYLKYLHRFLSEDAPQYRILIDQDFEPSLNCLIFITRDLAQIECSDSKVLNRIQKILAPL